VTYVDSVVDTTNAYPQGKGTQANPLLDSDIQAEVSYWMQARSWVAGPDTMIFVYTAYGVESCFVDLAHGCSFPTTAGNTYGGYHSYFAANVWQVSYASMPDSATHMDIFPGVPTSPNNDIIADNEISITSHEQFEMESDPLQNGWFDTTSSSGEIGDKCVRNYVSVNPDGSNVVMNGHPYILQAEWSNYQNGCALHLP
jgi:hypothetical protein